MADNHSIDTQLERKMDKDIYTIGTIKVAARQAGLLIKARDAAEKPCILCNGEFFSDAEMSDEGRKALVQDLNEGYRP